MPALDHLSAKISVNMSIDTRLTDWYVNRVSADSVNQYSAMGCPSDERSHLSTKATFFCPQGGHCGEVQLYLKIPWKSKIIMYTYM